MRMKKHSTQKLSLVERKRQKTMMLGSAPAFGTQEFGHFGSRIHRKVQESPLLRQNLDKDLWKAYGASCWRAGIGMSAGALGDSWWGPTHNGTCDHD